MKIEYNKLNEETRMLINKAIDIFDNINTKEMLVPQKNAEGNTKFVEFSLGVQEKVELSLFMAGFELEGNIKNVLVKYPKMQEIYEFFGLKKEDIAKFSIRDIRDKEKYYEDIYMSYFIHFLLSIKQYEDYVSYEDFGHEARNEMSPELIFRHLYYSNILNVFASAKLGIKSIALHPSKKEIWELLKRKELPKEKLIDVDDNKKIVDKFMKEIDEEDVDKAIGELDKENRELFERRYGTLPNEKTQEVELEEGQLWQILDEIKAKFIGQEDVCEKLFYNLLTNQMLARDNKVQDGERSIIFLDGPTGTGKTAISREITEKFGAPFVRTSSTNYSATGYVGGDLEDILEDLCKQANGDLERAERGIIVFDEFEKISYNSGQDRDLVMKQAVQHRLLDFMGGGKYQVLLGTKNDKKVVSFDTSKLTFICAGALTSLREKKTQAKPSLGFGAEPKNANIESYSITSEDLINMGLERELVGRLNTYLHTEEYSKESLYRILKESEISPIKGLISFVSKRGKKIEIEDDAYLEMVEEAYNLNTGARSLQTVVNSIRNRLLKEIFRGQDMVIKIDSDMVRETLQDMTSRKARR